MNNHNLPESEHSLQKKKKMKSIHGFLLFLITAYVILESVQAQDQLGFISLDCGLVPKNATYTEKTTNITYKSDANYIDSGLVGRISAEYKAQLQQQTWTVRSFPEGERNCYNFNLTAKSRYLIRATFTYGNYDGLRQVPKFDIHIGPSKWTSVKLDGVGNGAVLEMIHVLTQDRLQICLVKTGKGIPFISSLELRPLNNNTYLTQSGSLIGFARVFFSATPTFIRYDEDIHDRVWVRQFGNGLKSISTDLLVDTSNPYDVPQAVAKTACVPSNASQPLIFDWTLDNITSQSYVYMHFAEIQTLKDNDIREFNITYNGGQNVYSYLRPEKFEISTLFDSKPLSSPDGSFSLSFTKTGNSTLPPLINGLEIYKVLDLLELETDQDEGKFSMFLNPFFTKSFMSYNFLLFFKCDD
jgi:hypothetical protein